MKNLKNEINRLSTIVNINKDTNYEELSKLGRSRLINSYQRILIEVKERIDEELIDLEERLNKE